MKFLLLSLLSIIFIGCGQNDDTATQTPTYSLAYDSSATQITGQILFDLGTIPKDHTITLASFIPVMDGCNFDYTQSTITPSSMTFTPIKSQDIAIVSLKLNTICTNNELSIKATQFETTILDGKILTNKKDVVFKFSVTKTSSVSSFTPVLKTSTLEITQNSQTANIVVAVFDNLNRPAQEGKVSIVYPDIVKSGTDVGSFAPTTVDVKDGLTSFVYTAPNDLSALKGTSVAFQFYYNEDVANSTTLSLSFNPDPDQIVHKNYSLELKPENDNYQLELEDTKSFSITLVDDKQLTVPDTDISTITVSLENSFIALLFDNNTTGGVSATYEKNNITMALKSNTKSGLVSILVDANFKDENGNDRNISQTLSLVIQSGPPTAISISYVGTDQDEERAKFIERFAISVTDRYFNPINTRPGVSVGAIVGYAHFSTPLSNESNRIFIHDKADLLATLTTDDLNISQPITINSTDIDINNDILVTFGDSYRYPASGGWLFDGYTSNSISLLPNQYDGNITDKLGYAIGHNYRQDQCVLGQEWLGQTKLLNDVITLDEKGTAIAELSYDYYLVGKDILFYTNIIGHDNNLDKDLRVGEARKHTLRGHGIEFGEITTLISENNNTANRNFYLWLKYTGEGTGNSVAYKNANFSYETFTSGDGKSLIRSHSDQYSCGVSGRDGHMYLQYQIQADINATCSITVSNPKIISEF